MKTLKSTKYKRATWLLAGGLFICTMAMGVRNIVETAQMSYMDAIGDELTKTVLVRSEFGGPKWPKVVNNKH